jgi:peptidylprolyl isomerase
VRNRRSVGALLAGLVTVGLLAGCSSEGGGALGGNDLSQCKTPTSVNQAPAPQVSMPSRRPGKLVVQDLKVGSGAAAAAGSVVRFQYVGVACSTGVQFDSTWTNGGPLSYQLQYPTLIHGFVDGLAGMKAGGRRELVVPPTEGYGDSPPPGSGIKAGETLVFVVDLVGVS